MTPVTVTVTDKEVKLTTKCNGVGSCKKNKKKKNKNKQLHDVYTLPPDYLSHIVVIGTILVHSTASEGALNNTLFIFFY